MKALEAAGAGPRATHAEVELGPDTALLVVRTLEARPELGVGRRRAAPALDPARGLEPRDGRDEVRAGEPEGGRERLAVLVVGGLLRDRRPAKRAADDDPPERARGPA